MELRNKAIQNISIRKLIRVTGLTVVLGLVGCQQEGPAQTAGQKLDRTIENAGEKIESITEHTGKEISEARKSIAEKAEESAQYISDSVITSNVKTAIVSDPLLKASEIKVTTVNGTVQLSGMVDSQQVIDRASEVVSRQKDVKLLQNNLTVKAVLPK